MSQNVSVEVVFVCEGLILVVPADDGHGYVRGDTFIQPWFRSSDELLVTAVGSQWFNSEYHLTKVVRFCEIPRNIADLDFCPLSGRFCIVTDLNELMS